MMENGHIDLQRNRLWEQHHQQKAIGSKMTSKLSAAHSTTQIPFPSTSSATTTLNPLPFFNPHQIIHSSPPGTFQTMANSIFSPNPFLNPALFPLAPPGSSPSPADFSRMQQWFQQGSPYATPLASNAPSLANLSSLSLFTNDSTITLNSKISTKSKLKNDLNGDTVKTIMKLLSDPDQDIILQVLKIIKSLLEAVLSKKFPIDQKEFIELIRSIIELLVRFKNLEVIGPLLDLIATISHLKHYQLVVEQTPQVSQIFIKLIMAAAIPENNWNIHHAIRLLRIFNNTLTHLKDKSNARTQPIFNALMNFLKIPNMNVQFCSLGILRALIYRQEQWKKFFIEQNGIEMILKLLEGQNDRRYIKQAIQVLNTLVDSPNTDYAIRFIRSGGIKIILLKLDNTPESKFADIFVAFHCLQLVSDIPELAYVHQTDIAWAIRSALKCTFPMNPTTSSERDMYLKNITNALGFIRNAIVRNEAARHYLVSQENGKSIPYLIGFTNENFHILLSSTQSANDSNLSVQKIAHFKKMQQIFEEIVEHCLAILASINREMADGQITTEQRMASKKLAEDNTAMLLYQLILSMEYPVYHKSILMSLSRISNSGIMLPIENNGNHRMAETLLKFIFKTDADINSTRLPLMKQAAEVLTRLVSGPSRLHLSLITPLLINGNCQPFKFLLLDSINANTDLFLAILKLIKELCQRELNLKTLWLNDTNVNQLRYWKTTSNNQEIVNLCSKIFDMHQMQMDEDTSESTFYDILAQGMELDQSGLS